MSQSPPELPPTAPGDTDSASTPAKSAQTSADELGPSDRVQWFGRPDPGEKPLGFWHLVVITLSAHIGVRPRAKRHEDFRRANGLHVFVAAIVYFVLVISALILLTNLITNR